MNLTRFLLPLFFSLAAGAFLASDASAEDAPASPETPLGAGAPDTASPAPSVPETPLTLSQIVERDWKGKVELFPEERDMKTPGGYRIMSSPGEDAKLLKRMPKESSVDVKAILTLEDGTKFYVSGWSWDRAVEGRIPTWILPSGQVSLSGGPSETAPSSPVQDAPKESEPVSALVDESPDPMIRPTDLEQPGRIVALLLGNGHYSTRNPAHVSLDLPTADKDIKLLSEAFTKLRAEIVTLLDGDRTQIVAALETTINALQPNDTLIVYYTGHAVQIAGKNFLAPAGVSFVDKDHVRATSVPVDLLVTLLSARPHRFSSRANPSSSPA